MAYLDTSILGSYYFPEPLSLRVNRAVTTLRDPVISPLVEVEFCSLLSLKLRTREITRQAAHDALAKFRDHHAAGEFRRVDLEARDYAIAQEWLSSFGTTLRTLDALHLACAFGNGEMLWTTDKALNRSATVLHVACKLIE